MGRIKNRDATAVIVKVLGLAVLYGYENWKERCEEVEKVALPTRQQIQWSKIQSLKERGGEVEAREMCLFELAHVPTKADGLQQMVHWVQAVERSIERAKNKSVERMRRLEEYYLRS